jgi:hypothetical protein
MPPQQSLVESLQSDKRIRAFASLVLIMLSVYLLFAALSELKSYRYIGSGVTATNTINVSGDGEVFAVPDTATFSVTVQEEAKEVQAAQDVATKKGNDIIAYLKNQGIDEKDIQTTDYNVYPQYDYINGVCSDGGYCQPGKQTLRGFQVSQTLAVKVRDTEKAGTLLSGVGSLGASTVSGLSFTIADEDALRAEARDKAIEKAKAKADALADALGVTVVRVVGFSENSNYPIPYAKGGAVMAMDARLESSVAPELPVGQNKITSDVNITYEIR